RIGTRRTGDSLRPRGRIPAGADPDSRSVPTPQRWGAVEGACRRADEGVPRTGVPGAVGSAGARFVGASASTISTSPIRHRPAHPAGPRRSPTITTARTVAPAGSVRVTVVAVLAGTVVSPMPNSTYPRNIGTSAMYPATTRFWADATRGAPVSSSTGSSSAPPAPNTEPIAAGRAIPAVRRRCTDHEKVA